MDKKKLSWNPRYVKYAKAHGKTPRGMLAADKKTWPGGCMCGFILWTKRKLAAAKKAHPEWFMFSGELVDHVAFDNWLLPTLE